MEGFHQPSRDGQKPRKSDVWPSSPLGPKLLPSFHALFCILFEKCTLKIPPFPVENLQFVYKWRQYNPCSKLNHPSSRPGTNQSIASVLWSGTFTCAQNNAGTIRTVMSLPTRNEMEFNVYDDGIEKHLISCILLCVNVPSLFCNEIYWLQNTWMWLFPLPPPHQKLYELSGKESYFGASAGIRSGMIPGILKNEKSHCWPVLSFSVSLRVANFFGKINWCAFVLFQCKQN